MKTLINKRLQEDNERLNHLITSMEETIDDQEQRSRNQCLLIHGFMMSKI